MDTNDNELNASAFESNLKEGLIQAGTKKTLVNIFCFTSIFQKSPKLQIPEGPRHSQPSCHTC